MKAVKKVLTKILLCVVVAIFTLSTSSKTSAFDPQIALGILDWGMSLSKLIPDKKKKSKKSVIELIQESVIQLAAKQGKKITFGKLHEQIDLNQEAKILTYNGTVNNKKTFILLGFTYKGEPKKVAYKGCLWSDDQEEYKNTSKEQMRDYFRQYCNVDLGPIAPEIVKTPPAPATPVSQIPVPVTPASY